MIDSVESRVFKIEVPFSIFKSQNYSFGDVRLVINLTMFWRIQTSGTKMQMRYKLRNEEAKAFSGNDAAVTTTKSTQEKEPAQLDFSPIAEPDLRSSTGWKPCLVPFSCAHSLASHATSI